MPRARKPTEVHLLEGTFNATRHAGRESEPKPSGPIRKPRCFQEKAIAAIEAEDATRAALLREASDIWDTYAAIGYWFTSADSEILLAWSLMTAQLHAGGLLGDPARIAQWRMLGQELGLSPASRSKINTQAPDDKPHDPAEKFFVS